MLLESRTALVTGGGRGIGRAIALAFAREGADVCVLARTRAEVDAAADEARSLGRRALARTCDVGDYAAVEASVAAAVEELGTIDVLVNNAGGGTVRLPVGDDDPGEWASVVRTNLVGAYHVTRAVVPHMRRTGGNVINVGSGMGYQAVPGNSSYSAAKAGLRMLTRCLALELREHDVLVNELLPGPVETALVADHFDPDDPPDVLRGEWFKQPEDVVPLALFLAAQPRTGPTGQAFSLARRPL